MSVFVRDGGVWKESGPGGISIKDSGIWKSVQNGYVRDANVWKEYYQNLPAIGEPLQGGFFVGLISQTSNGVATHALIVAPKSSETALKWSSSETNVVTSTFDGALNTTNIVNSGGVTYDAFNYCRDYVNEGFTDWYFPARYELEIAYYNLKPTSNSNATANSSNSTNPFAVPARNTPHTSFVPGLTSSLAFRNNAPEGRQFALGRFWSSTQSPSTYLGAVTIRFEDGDIDTGAYSKNGNFFLVRPFRKIAL